MSAVNRARLGGAAWSLFVLVRVVPDFHGGAWVQALLLFAALVLVPLALELLAEEGETGYSARGFAWAGIVQLPAALLLAGAHGLPPGTLAALLALPWAAFTGLLAVVGFLRVRRDRFRRSFEGLCADAALIYAAVGGAWVLAERAGFSPLGFDAAIVALTAVHFHYAGLLLPLFAGLVQRELFIWRTPARAAVGVVLGVPAVAIGITTTQLGWGTSVETAAGCGLALAGMVVGILHVRLGIDGRQPGFTRVLLVVTGAALFIGMVFAAIYALRGTLGGVLGLGIPEMRMVHGTINALGFGLCGVLAWRRMRSPETTT